MKVSAIHTAQPVEQVSGRSKRAGTKEAPSSEISVQVSADALWVSDVKDAASLQEDVDTEAVERAQRDIADGQLDQRMDWEEVLDSLIMEL